MAGIPDDVKQKLLADPAVQTAMKQVGKEAAASLQDPAVQAQLLEVCKEKFPQYAATAKTQIKELVNDPKIQAAAREYAGQAAHYVVNAGGILVAQIQQGPAGVRFLGFCGGIASAVLSVMAIINPLGLVFGPVAYLLCSYQFIFSLTTVIFEMPPEYVAKVPVVSQYQDLLLQKAKFLSETLGRGLFYIFQGSLWLCFASLKEFTHLLIGLWMIFIGVLNIMIHYGNYNSFAEKVAAGYQSLSRSGP